MPGSRRSASGEFVVTDFQINWAKLFDAVELTPFNERKPFPYLVVDDLWNDDALEAASAEFPSGNDPRWITYPDPKEFGKRAGDSRMWGPVVNDFFDYVRSFEVCVNLAELTGIAPLTADDIGGGMHMTGEGGRLATHVDFNVHPNNPALERRLNMLVFLNDVWDASWGGALKLGKPVQVQALPSFNRTVIFATSSKSWHGHPDPVVGDHWRKSLACYYYAPLREETGEAHSTLWGE